MMHILKCQKCGKYTMKELCGCGGAAAQARPPKFSVGDAYGSYRRKAKSAILKEKGLL